MRRFVAMGVVFLSAVFGARLEAQNRTTWSVELEGGLGSAWRELRVGDRFVYAVGYEFGEISTLNYSVRYNPLVATGGTGSSFRAEVLRGRTENPVSLGVAFSRTSSRGTVREYVSTPVNLLGAVGCRMWDHTIFPVYNSLEPSLISPVDCWGENRNSYWTTDAFVLVSLLESERFGLAVSAGPRVAGTSAYEEIGQKQFAFVYGAFGRDTATNEWIHGRNDITLRSTSSSRLRIAGGPSFGLRVRFSPGRFNVVISVNQSVLFGEALLDATWIDRDSIYEVRGPVGGPFTPGDPYALYNGVFSSRMIERAVMPVTGFGLKVSHTLNKDLSLGLTGFVSLWSNVPEPQKWSVSAPWTLEYTTGWSNEKSGRVFGGVRGSVKYNF